MNNGRWKILVSCALAFAAGYLAPPYILGLFSKNQVEERAFSLQYSLSAFQEVLMLGVPALILYLSIYGKEDLRSRMALPDSYSAGLAMLSAVSFTMAGSLLVAFWLAFLTSFGFVPTIPTFISPQTPIQYVLAFLLAALIPAVSEELLFRGVLLRLLQKARGDRMAVYGSAFLFALLHFSLEGFPALFVIGIVLGWAAVRYQNLMLPMLFHMVYNMAAVTINASETVPSITIMMLSTAIFTITVRVWLRGEDKERT